MGGHEAEPVVARINLATEPEFDLGAMRVKPAERAIVVDGQRTELQPRVMQVLVALAKARPGVVSRAGLSEQCWEGRIVGDDALNRCVLALRHLAENFTPPPFEIDTVARVGHRLIEHGTSRDKAPQRGPFNRRRIAALLVVLLVALAIAFYGWQRRTTDPQPASIALLPFRNLGDGDSYFAEGLGEEILGQLAHEPQFRVAGGSSSGFVANHADVREVGRQLNVDYVIEGTVRRQGDRVRVNAHLLRTNDGSRLWSDSYDGNLDDIFAIQRRIGAAIAGALSRKLVRVPTLTGPLVTDGNAYNLYLTARGLIRSRSRRAGPIAADLLRDAIKIDKGYAPAWASLGQATLLAGALKDSESFVASVSEARGYARHSLRLAPDLAEAHVALGSMFGFGTAQSTAHLRRAAELEPNNSDNMLALGAAHGAAGEFEQELAAYRRASELDPLWFRATGSLALAIAELGDRSGAETIARQVMPPNGIERNLLLGKIAAISGDHSEAIRLWSIVSDSNSPRWSNNARLNRDGLAHAMSLAAAPATIPPRPLNQRHLWWVSMTQAPSPSIWLSRNRNHIAASVYRDENHVAAKLMLNTGRWRELVKAYDGAGGVVGIKRQVPLRVDQLSEAPVAALALRHAGQHSDADRLLAEAGTLSVAVNRRGRVPVWFDADAAALLAVQGHKKEAVARLAKAVERGWRHGGVTDLGDLADEPAFRLLSGDPGFEQLRRRLSAHEGRERAESIRLGIIPRPDKKKGRGD